MSTMIKHIEKEFLFKWLCEEQTSLVYIRDHKEYHFNIANMGKDTLHIRADRPILDLNIGENIDLLCDFRGTTVSCTFKVTAKGDQETDQDSIFVVHIPEVLHRDLKRSFFRVPFPDNLTIEFSFEDNYKLPYHRIQDVEILEQVMPQKDPLPKQELHNLNNIITEFTRWVKQYADGIKVVLFKDTKPITVEEQVIIKTGKTLFLPSTEKEFIMEDPFPEKRLITKALFKAYLKSTGENPILLDIVTDKFLQSEYLEGIFSAVWVPLFFQGYIIGYIHVWVTTKKKRMLEYTIIERLYQFTKYFVASIKAKGYFEAYRMERRFICAQGIDISPSGIHFTFLSSSAIPVVLPGVKLFIKLTTAESTMVLPAQIVWCNEERSSMIATCRFLDLTKEDSQRLFELLYGESLTDLGASLLTGSA